MVGGPDSPMAKNTLDRGLLGTRLMAGQRRHPAVSPRSPSRQRSSTIRGEPQSKLPVMPVPTELLKLTTKVVVVVLDTSLGQTP